MGTSGRPVPGGSPEPSQPTGLGPSPAYGYWISYSRIPPGGSSLRSPVWVVEELCPIRGLCGLSAAVWSWSPVGSTMPNTRRPPGPAVRQFPQRVWGGPGGGGVLHPLPFVLQDPNPFPQALRHKAPLATRTPRCTWALSTPGPVLRAPSHPDLPSRPLHFQQGVPEDLLFFYNHLRKGGGVIRVDQSLLLYRYHPHAATHAVLEYDHHVDTPRPLPGGAGPATLGSLHHLECWQAGPLALPQPDRQSTAQGGGLLRRGREEDQEGLLLLRGLSGKAQAPGSDPALPSRTATLRNLREAGLYSHEAHSPTFGDMDALGC
nr:UDP-GlcNAc:betaGal beta-1,3-N-acetylglucosaminyltransferase-like protein 1 isoform X12 [Manis javanica]